MVMPTTEVTNEEKTDEKQSAKGVKEEPMAIPQVD
jgi:hypothetical protein